MSVTLADPLSEVSRKERRMLLALSMLGVFFTHGGVLPTKVTTLGIELNAGEQKAFLLIFAVGLSYFLIAFFLYATSDFLVWKRKITDEFIVQAKEEVNSYMFDSQPQTSYEAEIQFVESKARKRYEIWARLTKPVSFLRALFEFLLPLLFAGYSIATVLEYAFMHT